jgi:hypothetical protein
MFSAVVLSLCLTSPAPAQTPQLKGNTITLLVGHHFSRSDAHERVQQLVDYWKNRYHVSQSWSGDRVAISGTVVGVPFQAFLEVTDGAVRCESSDPGALLRGSARDYVQKKLRKYLHPQYAEP